MIPSTCRWDVRTADGWSVSGREWTQATDEALNQFVERGEWRPLSSGPVRYQVWIRVLFGLDWMLMNADAGMPVPVNLAGGVGSLCGSFLAGSFPAPSHPTGIVTRHQLLRPMEFATCKTRFLEGCCRLHPLTDTFSKVLGVAGK